MELKSIKFFSSTSNLCSFCVVALFWNGFMKICVRSDWIWSKKWIRHKDIAWVFADTQLHLNSHQHLLQFLLSCQRSLIVLHHHSIIYLANTILSYKYRKQKNNRMSDNKTADEKKNAKFRHRIFLFCSSSKTKHEHNSVR